MAQTQDWTFVTGAAGFIGFHTARALLDAGRPVVGLDNMNAYYDPALKRARLERLLPYGNFRFIEADLCDRAAVEGVYRDFTIRKTVHLAAQAGVRYSLQSPRTYIDSNIVGFLNILENCRASAAEHLVYASSSSVYGLNEHYPFSEDDAVDHPASLYAATKKSNELMAHTYGHLYGVPTTGLRFFTVYGPWGRPDMAIYKFTEAILAGRPIDVYNNGKMKRDFTYVDDIVEGVVRVLDAPPAPNPADALTSPATARAPYRVYNIGNNRPVPLSEFIETIEDALGCKAEKNYLPMQPGDVLETFADLTRLEAAVGFAPKTELRDGVRRFVEWYREYHG